MSHWRPWLLILLALSFGAYADTISERINRLERDTANQAVQRVQGVLERYCPQHCQLLDVRVEVHETLADSDELGFESLEESRPESKLEVQSVRPVIQIDQRVMQVDRDRLESLLRNAIKNLGPETSIGWETVELPAIGNQAAPQDELENQLESRIRRTLQSIIDRYCPDQCLLDRIEIDAVPVTPEQLRTLPSDQVVRGKRQEGGLQIQDVHVQLTLDELLTEEERERILRLMQAQTRFVQPITFSPIVTSFPEPAADKKKRALEEATDPYGLEKLRQMLILFRDLAGTKEVIQTVESKSSLEQSSRLEATQERRDAVVQESKLESSSATNTSSSETSSEAIKESETSRRLDVNNAMHSASGLSTEELAAYAAGLLLLFGLIGILILRFAQAQKTAREMVLASGTSPYSTGRTRPAIDMEGGSHGEAGQAAPVQQGDTGPQKAMMGLRLAQLKQEMVQQFIEQPAVARETFSRLLKDEGVAETAKYIAIFGQLIVFELLNDASLKRDLYELSEYYHRSNLKFDPPTELALLERLKTMVTAAEIRLLANQSSERFGFLSRLDGQQIYNLIADESPRVQSIVLTQLDRKKRSAVFELYNGEAKIRLLEELSMAEAIPREFLFNVAQALQKKIQQRSEFDVENLRSSDILLDLLERASLGEQQRLMRTLERQNPETARGLKLKLVTVEMLPYLKDGHLLEVVLGMERDDLLAFLVGSRESIREMLLRKVPEELAHSWLEDIRHLTNVDDNAYRMAEMKIKGRIRSLANNGAISLLDINELIFSQALREVAEEAGEERVLLSKGAFAA